MKLFGFNKLKIWQKLLIAGLGLFIGIGVIAGMISAIIEIANKPKANTPSVTSVPSSVSISTPSPTPENTKVVMQARRDPQKACEYLAHLEGFRTGGYKLFDDNDYSCLNNVYKLGDEFPLPNTITYFANGDAKQVKELELHLNVNVRSKANEAHSKLLFYGEELAKRAIDTNLPENIKTSIMAGKPGNWHVKDAMIELKRDDWPTGKGYTLDFFIR